jgi:hypothetical protein
MGRDRGGSGTFSYAPSDPLPTFPRIIIDILLELLLTRSHFVTRISRETTKFLASEILGDVEVNENPQFYPLLWYPKNFRFGSRLKNEVRLILLIAIAK